MLSLRRADTIAFWLLGTTLVCVSLGLVAAVWGAQSPWLWGAGGVSVLVPGLVWEPWFETGVKAWNKGARLVASALRTYVLMVCYYVLVGAVSRAGASRHVAPEPAPVASRWAARRGRDSREDGALPSMEERWRQELNASAQRPGQGWVLCLFPCVFLLRLLGEEGHDGVPPSSTYTLY